MDNEALGWQEMLEVPRFQRTVERNCGAAGGVVQWNDGTGFHPSTQVLLELRAGSVTTPSTGCTSIKQQR
ncbi:MAG: hypothetical protein IPK63_16300 [Candidatus Competibacteraceae bacterium]|nr:hypothetical protein [Candidatus Competibacteraceae bacterium]